MQGAGALPTQDLSLEALPALAMNHAFPRAPACGAGSSAARGAAARPPQPRHAARGAEPHAGTLSATCGARGWRQHPESLRFGRAGCPAVLHAPTEPRELPRPRSLPASLSLSLGIFGDSSRMEPCPQSPGSVPALGSAAPISPSCLQPLPSQCQDAAGGGGAAGDAVVYPVPTAGTFPLPDTLLPFALPPVCWSKVQGSSHTRASHPVGHGAAAGLTPEPAVAWLYPQNSRGSPLTGDS